jgi:hypothetical protein
MRSNPLQFLTERQIKLLAQQEGISVSQLLAKYDRLRARTSKARKPSAKGSSARRSGAQGRRLNPAQNAGLAKGQSLMAEAAEAYHNGQYDSMPEALSGVAAERRNNPYGRYR